MSHRDGTEIEALVARMAAGDQAALDALYAATSPRVYALCLSMLGDRIAAQDALEEVYVALWQQAGQQGDSGLSARAWLAVMARNHAAGQRARQRAPAPAPRMSAPAAPGAGALDECLALLPPVDAACLRAAWLQGAGHADLAASAGTTPEALRTRLRGAILWLQDCISR